MFIEKLEQDKRTPKDENKGRGRQSMEQPRKAAGKGKDDRYPGDLRDSSDAQDLGGTAKMPFGARKPGGPPSE